MESSIYKNITWRDDVYNQKKALEQTIIDAKNILQNEIDERLRLVKMKIKEDNEISSIISLRQYTPRKIDVVVRPLMNEHRIMFRFWYDNFSWNEYKCEFTYETYFKCLEEIGNTIIKEFPILYGGVNFVSYIESQRYWTYKHYYVYSI